MSTIDYKTLSHEDFDAMVTGELTHIAIWFEHEIIELITDYFVTRKTHRGNFKRLLLMRDGLSFQDKIEITRAMLPLLKPDDVAGKISGMLKKIEDFKVWRNALVHGLDCTGSAKGQLIIEIVNRAGREKQVTITPESHEKMFVEMHQLVEDFRELRKALHS